MAKAPVPGSRVELTPSSLSLIAFDVRNGKANRKAAECLLSHFCECVEADKAIPRRLIEHVREAFRAYLNRGRTLDVGDGPCAPRALFVPVKTLDAAFGLVRKPGRPEADEQLRIRMAAEVLRRRLTLMSNRSTRAGRLKPMSQEEAVAEVSNKFGRAESVVNEAWRDYRTLGFDLLTIERGSVPWTDEEKRRLRKIFPPEKSPM